MAADVGWSSWTSHGNGGEATRPTDSLTQTGFEIVWIGIVLGAVVLFAAIAVAIWCLIWRRSQKTDEEISDSLEFVAETDEQILLATARVECQLLSTDGRRNGLEGSDEGGLVFEEAFL
jgi:hypothetical protein